MIKVRAGQVWKRKLTDHEIKICEKASVGFYISTGYATERVIQSDFEFVPQNDLERMAIDTPEWHWGDHCFYRHGGMVTKENHTKIFKSEWQNMRYHLGLDEKPRCRLIKGEWVKQ